MLKFQQKKLLFKSLIKISKNQVLALITSASVTKTSKKKEFILVKIIFINYLLCFKKNTNKMRDLVNIITPAYILKLDFRVCYIKIEAQNINISIFKTFRIVLANFQIEDKLSKI